MLTIASLCAWQTSLAFCECESPYRQQKNVHGPCEGRGIPWKRGTLVS